MVLVAYGFVDLTILLELGTKSLVVGVPGEARTPCARQGPACSVMLCQ
jgi:hypothetical protein